MAIPCHHRTEACSETRSSRACASAGLDAEVGYRAGTGQQEVRPSAVPRLPSSSSSLRRFRPPRGGRVPARRGRPGLPALPRGAAVVSRVKTGPRAVASAMRSSVKAGEAARTMRGAPGDERRSRFRALDPMERAGRFHAACPGAGRLRRRPVRSSRPGSACGWCSSDRPIPRPRSWWLPWSRVPRASATRIPAWSGRNSMAARC